MTVKRALRERKDDGRQPAAATPPPRATGDPLAQLNAAQRAAVTFGIGGRDDGAGDDRHRPLLIIAGAGSGKTATLDRKSVV